MLCMECGAEMRLVEIAKDNTMPVSGFEHRTWQCSACSAVERRMTFTREKTPAKPEPVEPTRTVLVAPIQTFQTAPVKSALAEPSKQVQPDQAQPAQTALLQPTRAVPAEPTETVALKQSQTVLVGPTHTAPKDGAVQTKPPDQVQTEGTEPTGMVLVEPVLTAMVEPLQTVRHPEAPAAMTQIEARAKALEEKVRNFKERMTTAKKVAGDTKRDAQFNRNRDNEFRSVPPPSGLSNTSGQTKPDELVLSPTEPIASSAPISDDKSIAPASNAPAAQKLRKTLGGLVRAIAPKGLSRVR